jgi:hypothetical protein
MKACRLNLKTKLLCEKSGNFKTANEILKASYLLRYSTLKQLEGESGADFVDCKQKEYTARNGNKFIQQDTTNSKYKSLPQTIFISPNSI